MKTLYNLLTWPIINILSNLFVRINQKTFLFKEKFPSGVINNLNRIAMEESTSYFKKFESEIMLFHRREDLWDYTLNYISDSGLILEFGVWYGRSINYMAKKLKNRNFVGFDSFEGLQEDWFGTWMPKNFFDQKGKLPKVPKNVKLIKGWFNKTLPNFLNENKDQFAIIHIDCDTYYSTKEIFELIGKQIKKGSIIIFDEYHGNPGWKEGEFKAFKEFVTKNKIKYKYIGITNKQCSVLIY